MFRLIELLSKGGKIKPLNKNFNLRDAEKDNILNELGEEEYNKYCNEGNEMKLNDAVLICTNIDN